jgi:3-carboxy-cis,cis-muconate cycloisomerase
LPSEPLLGPSYAAASVRVALDDEAWLQAMLDVEAALAGAAADVGLVARTEADAVAEQCHADRFDVGEIGARAATAGNPVIPLVADLRAAVPDHAARAVHVGATSQDVLDTSLMLLARRTIPTIDAALARAIAAAAAMAERHRDDVQPGRTLLQHAVPITFGLTAATWLVGLVEARAALDRVATERLAVQLGGAAGTLAPLGEHGVAVMERLADRLGLATPTLPWATSRGRVVELAGALVLVAGSAGKVATDVIGLMQTEVDEVREPDEPGRGGSSAMPHKRNPASATLVVSAAHQVVGAASVVLGAQLQVHQRAAGPWHAEWDPLRRALLLTAGAAERVADLLEGLDVDAARMRTDLDRTGGMVMTESVVSSLVAAGVDHAAARATVETCLRAAQSESRPLADMLALDPVVRSALGEDGLHHALDPRRHLGATDAFIDRALTTARGATTP